MRKDNLIDKPTVVSLLGAAVSAALMVAFAIAYRIAGLFVPDTNAVMSSIICIKFGPKKNIKHLHNR